MVLRYRRNSRVRRRRFRRTTRRTRKSRVNYRRRANSSRIAPRRMISPANLGRNLQVGGQMKMIHTTKLPPYGFATDTDTAATAGQIVAAVFTPTAVRFPFGPAGTWEDFQMGISESTTPATQFSGEVVQNAVTRFADSFLRFSIPWAVYTLRITNKETFPIVIGVQKEAHTPDGNLLNFGHMLPVVNMAGSTAFALPHTQRYRIGAFDAAKPERNFTKTIKIYCPMHADWKKISPFTGLQHRVATTDVSAAQGICTNVYRVWVTAQPALITDSLTSATDPPATDIIYPLIVIQAEVSQCVLYQDPK